MLGLERLDIHRWVMLTDEFPGEVEQFVVLLVDGAVDEYELVLLVFWVDQGPNYAILLNFASN
jgi:hypothetical protein